MFEFQEDVRKAYEAIPIPLVIDRFIDEKVVPILVSDGFCRLAGDGTGIRNEMARRRYV